ncbi:helix-turn-helix domain-containing protein [Candidatus Gottesmanbacteria bacterium]|nr:helix-turn-helix domain-containing protein [Candidatus Gottesmanbacteria bacterium]
MENIYTVKQVAEKLQVSLLTVRRYIKAGKLQASKLGKDYRILETDIMKFLQNTKIQMSK